MSPAVWIFLLVLVPIVGFIVWLVLLDTSIRIEPGTLGLLIVRGRATGRAMTPGRHFVRPWRKGVIQTYPSRELAFVAGGGHMSNPDVDYIDEPLKVTLADGTTATMKFTVRCQLIPKKVQDIHDSFGPEGIWAALRDTSRRLAITEARASGVTAADAVGRGYGALEQRINKGLKRSLGDIGFELHMFNVRELDLGDTGEVIQAAVRADAELQREQAMAEVRRTQAANDAALVADVPGLDFDQVLRYRQIEAWRELTERWSGIGQIPMAISEPLHEGSAWATRGTRRLRPERHRDGDDGGEGADVSGDDGDGS